MESRQGIAARPSTGAIASLPGWLQASAEEAGSQPFGNPLTAKSAVIEAAKAALPGVMAQLEGAGDETRGALLLALVDHTVFAPDHALRSGDAGRIRQFWLAYHEDLASVPAGVLQAACRAVRSRPLKAGDVRWFPAPGDLMALARQDERWRHAVKVAAGLSRLAKATPERVSEPVSEAEQAALDAKWRDFQARMDAAAATTR